mmetsp:Transcript_16183/g.50635  ORF Transcript_16183/g.50635 Transcript_16183/m.50635 type:complete len:248 (+) Transcript_16183:530-1273(+)
MSHGIWYSVACGVDAPSSCTLPACMADAARVHGRPKPHAHVSGAGRSSSPVYASPSPSPSFVGPDVASTSPNCSARLTLRSANRNSGFPPALSTRRFAKSQRRLMTVPGTSVVSSAGSGPTKSTLRGCTKSRFGSHPTVLSPPSSIQRRSPWQVARSADPTLVHASVHQRQPRLVAQSPQLVAVVHVSETGPWSSLTSPRAGAGWVSVEMPVEMSGRRGVVWSGGARERQRDSDSMARTGSTSLCHE